MWLRDTSYQFQKLLIYFWSKPYVNINFAGEPSFIQGACGCIEISVATQFHAAVSRTDLCDLYPWITCKKLNRHCIDTKHSMHTLSMRIIKSQIRDELLSVISTLGLIPKKLVPNLH